MSKQHVGQVFARWRKQAGYTFDEVSAELDCGRSALLSIEQGRNYPSFQTVCKFLLVSGLEFDVLADAFNAEAAG